MKRILSLLIVLTMLFSMVPSVFADATENEALSTSENIVAALNEGNDYMAHYHWVVEKAGELTVNYYADLDDTTGITVEVNGEDAGLMEAMAVEAGQTVEVWVTSEDIEATVTVYAMVTEPAGTEGNPIFLGDIKTTVENAGTLYYVCYFSGCDLTISGADFTVIYNGETLTPANGVVSITLPAVFGWPMPTNFAIVGDGEFVVEAVYPAGSSENPAELLIDEQVISVEAGTQGYYFTWTAEEDGVLSVYVECVNGWTYVLNNMTAYKYGETQWSDSDPVVNPGTVEVSAGDEVQLIVNTYDPADMWNAPAGDVVVVASFEAGTIGGGEEGGEEGGDVTTKEEYVVDYENMLVLGENELTLNASATTTVYEFCPEEAGVYQFVADDANALVGYWGAGSFYVWDQTENKTNTLEASVTAVGQSIMVGVSGVESCTLTITRTGDAASAENEYTVYENKNLDIDSNYCCIGNYVNINDTTVDTAVLGADGYYHLNSENGPVLFVDFAHETMSLTGLVNAPGNIRYTDGEVYIDYAAALGEYCTAASENGNLYPLTADMIEMLQNIGEAKGWYMEEIGWVGSSADAWMFACVEANLLIHMDAVEACHVPGIQEYWYCAACEAVYGDAEGTIVTNRKNLEIPADCELVHMEAADACHANGSAEYWFCPECEAVFSDAEGKYLTNRMNLTIPADMELTHVPAVEATCHQDGCQEYWYCADCESVYSDADGIYLTNRKNLTIAAEYALVYVEAVEATANTDGNHEYWYCPACEAVFADAAGIQLTNRMNLVIPATGVAMNEETGVTYKTIAEALAAAQTGDVVTVLVDSVEGGLVIKAGVTLDLGAHTVEAEYIIGLNGSCITGAAVDAEGANGAKLIVDQNNIALSNTAADGKVLPVWNEDHYIFANAVIYNPKFTAGNDNARVDFLPIFSTYVKNVLFKADGCADNDVSVIISVSWMENGIQVTQEYFYTTQLIIDAMNNKGLYATMTGCDAKEDLVFNIAIVADCGVEIVSESYEYNA